MFNFDVALKYDTRILILEIVRNSNLHRTSNTYFLNKNEKCELLAQCQLPVHLHPSEKLNYINVKIHTQTISI